nr:DUF3558 domain-containing protein [Nocardia carnea]
MRGARHHDDRATTDRAGSGYTAARRTPWSLFELYNHPCTVLGPEDLLRFGLTGPGEPNLDFGSNYCRWGPPHTAPEGLTMYFASNIFDRFSTLEDAERNEEGFRTLDIAGRPAFLVDRYPNGHRNCMIWVQVASGGLFQTEYVPRAPTPGQDVCGPAIEITTVIAERIR